MELLEKLRHTTKDQFQVERELGRGGMGAVFLAHDLALERPVAIKVLPPELAAQQSLRDRFLREARAAAGFSHPHVVPVHAVREADDLLLFVMGYIEGETLAQRVRRAGPLQPQDAARLMQEVAWALCYAHGRGVIHRDIKPDNILLERTTGRALVADFGIARTSMPGTSLTTVGDVVGTPEYMSPEQASGDAVDGRSDLYSLGATMYFAVTGEPPFRGDTVQAVLAMHLTREPAPLATRRPDLPAPLVDAIEQCLAKDPEARPAGGNELAVMLERLRATAPDVAPPIRVFYQRAAQATRITILLLPVTAVVVRIMMPTADADAITLALLVLAGLAGVWRGVMSAARSLLRRGFRFEDVRDGVRAILHERFLERDYVLAAPGARQRRTRRLAIQGGMIVAAVAIWLILVNVVREEYAPGRYRVGSLGVVLGIGFAILLATGVVGLLTEPTRVSVVERLMARLWWSGFGRGVFSLAGWRMRRGEASSGGTGTLGPRTPLDTFDTLPREMRGRFGDIRQALEELDRRATEQQQRTQELERAVDEARALTPVAAGASDERREALIADLVRAFEEERDRGAQVAASLENVRVQLIRLRSGIGTPEELRTEIARATELFAA